MVGFGGPVIPPHIWCLEVYRVRTLVEKKNTNQYFFQLIIQTEITCSPPEKVTEKKKNKKHKVTVTNGRKTWKKKQLHHGGRFRGPSGNVMKTFW